MSLIPIGWTHTAMPRDISEAEHSDKRDADRPAYLDGLPTELKLAIIHADPDAALALMDTTHEFETLVCEGPLRPIYDYFGQSPGRLRSFLQSGIRSGKTAAQLVRLAEVFHEVTSAPLDYVRYRARYLVELGMLTPRIYNAMCPSFLQILCEKDTLTFAFSRRFPLLSESELGEHRNMMRPYMDEREINHASELDIVLLRVAPSLGHVRLLKLAGEQLSDRNRFGRYLIERIFNNRGEAVERAKQDGAALAYTLTRYFCADDLRFIDCNRRATDGALYRTAFGGRGRSSADRQSADSASAGRDFDHHWQRCHVHVLFQQVGRDG
jgi:hypothetical protein